jgi:hypothetical protein
VLLRKIGKPAHWNSAVCTPTLDHYGDALAVLGERASEWQRAASALAEEMTRAAAAALAPLPANAHSARASVAQLRERAVLLLARSAGLAVKLEPSTAHNLLSAKCLLDVCTALSAVEAAEGAVAKATAKATAIGGEELDAALDAALDHALGKLLALDAEAHALATPVRGTLRGAALSLAGFVHESWTCARALTTTSSSPSLLPAAPSCSRALQPPAEHPAMVALAARCGAKRALEEAKARAAAAKAKARADAAEAAAVAATTRSYIPRVRSRPPPPPFAARLPSALPSALPSLALRDPFSSAPAALPAARAAPQVDAPQVEVAQEPQHAFGVILAPLKHSPSHSALPAQLPTL